MQGELSWEQLVTGLRTGDSEACRVFWQRFGPLLEAVAHKQLSARVLRRVGPDDIVQSACRTFFRRVSDGQFELPDSDALWRLMCAITLTKARRVARDQGRKKRGLNQEHSLEGVGSGDEPRRIDIAGGGPSPEEAVEVADQLEVLLQGLDPEECQVLDGKMQQLTNDEIASKLGCSERTVRRLAKNIHARWQTMMDDLSQ
jgi:RNA polymerase sigma factor (sigma-70 family)